MIRNRRPEGKWYVGEVARSWSSVLSFKAQGAQAAPDTRVSKARSRATHTSGSHGSTSIYITPAYALSALIQVTTPEMPHCPDCSGVPLTDFPGRCRSSGLIGPVFCRQLLSLFSLKYPWWSAHPLQRGSALHIHPFLFSYSYRLFYEHTMARRQHITVLFALAVITLLSISYLWSGDSTDGYPLELSMPAGGRNSGSTVDVGSISDSILKGGSIAPKLGNETAKCVPLCRPLFQSRPS